MKKLKLLLPALLLTLLANSQAGQINQINIISFTVKSVLPGNIDSWMSTPGALIMVAQKVPNPRMVEPRLVIQIRSGGAVICGNNAATAKQVDPFDVRTFNTADLTGFLTNCHELKEGTYTICAQFFNIDKIAISREVCKEFKVESQKTDYSPPQNITPSDKKRFTEKEISLPVTFRWTPLVPKPKEPVTYRLKVWQLMQGQNGTQAMRTNQPIVTKDVDNLTQTTILNLTSGPCKPPYLCEFIWTVEASIRHAGAAPQVIGTSEPTMFAANICDVNLSLKLISVTCLKSENGFNIYRICVASTYLSPVYPLTYSNAGSGFSAYHPSYTPTYTVSTVTPVLLIQNIGPSSTVNYCVDVAVPIGQSAIKLGLQGDDKDPGPIVCQPGAELDINLPPCKCEACDEKNLEMNIPVPGQINWNNNTLSFNQPIFINTIPPKTIKSITAELVYYEMKSQIDDCLPCNKDASLYGHFTNGTNSQQWTGSQTSLNINITTPNVPCCGTLFKWCIRYKVEFTDCTVCSKVICYEKKKEGCLPTGGGTGNPNTNNPK